MKSPDQIYTEVEAQWTKRKLERKRVNLGRVIDLVLVVVPWSLVFGWAIAGHQHVVAVLCLPLVVGSGLQVQKRWAVEERLDRLEQQQRKP